MTSAETFATVPGCPLRRQVAARLAAEIRDGRVAGGARLPGVRPMAGHLGVHRHTVAAAYRELSREGLVRTVPGHGSFVAEPDPSAHEAVGKGGNGAGTASAGAFRRLLAGERAAGRTAAELGRLLEGWRRARRAPRLAVVDPEFALRALAAAEVRAATGVEVRPLPPPPAGAGDTAGPDRGSWTAVLARRRLLPDLEERFPPWTELLPLPLAGGLEALWRVRALPPASVVAVVTRSRWLGRHYRALLAPEARRGIALARPDPGDARAVRRARRIAAFLLVDASCVESPGLAGCRRARRIRVLRPEPLRELAGWLAGPAPPRDGAGGAGRETEDG